MEEEGENLADKIAEKRELERMLVQAKSSLAALEDNLKVKQSIMKRAQCYEEQLATKHQQLLRE